MACSVTTKYPKTSPWLHPSSNMLDSRYEVFVLTVQYGQKFKEQSCFCAAVPVLRCSLSLGVGHQRRTLVQSSEAAVISKISFCHLHCNINVSVLSLLDLMESSIPIGSPCQSKSSVFCLYKYPPTTIYRQIQGL